MSIFSRIARAGIPAFTLLPVALYAGVWVHTDLTALTGAPPPPPAVYPDELFSYVFKGQNTQHINYLGSDDHVYELWCDNNSGWHYGDLTAATDAPSAGRYYARGYMFEAQGTQHVNYWGWDRHIYELWWDGSWHYNDLTSATGAPLAATEPRGYMFDSQGTQHVNYLGLNNHIYELWWDVDSGWHYNDLTAAASAPTSNGEPFGYVSADQKTQHVVYRSAYGSIHDLWWDGGWHDADLTYLAGAPAAQSDPYAYVFAAQGTQHVNYEGFDLHIHELWWDGTWHHNDLTAATGAPDSTSWPFSTGAPFGYATSDGTQHVNYVASNGHVSELWWNTEGWHYYDLTADTGAPLAASFARGYWFDSQNAQHVNYIGVDGHVHDLANAPDLLTTVPGVTGSYLSTASAAITNAGLTWTYMDTAPKTRNPLVVDQYPEGGAIVAKGTVVKLRFATINTR